MDSSPVIVGGTLPRTRNEKVALTLAPCVSVATQVIDTEEPSITIRLARKTQRLALEGFYKGYFSNKNLNESKFCTRSHII